MMRPHASLEDRHRFTGDPYYLNGTQSLVRLLQLELRARASRGVNAAVYVSGYRGSPLGGLDQAFTRARSLLDPAIRLATAVNEDLAATAVWGTQQVGTFAPGRVQGVSAAWYGKGPGVDRTGDVFKHANLAGSAREGGVLVIAGDDHTCKSSTTAHQSEFALLDAMIPVLAPATVFEQMEYGLIGWELSRQTGLWIAMKVVTEIMDSAETVLADPVVDLVRSPDLPPPGTLSLRWPDSPLAQEERLHRVKLPAALALARANRLDRVMFGRSDARIGIVTVGKAHGDTLQALADLGIDESRAAALGLRLYKVAMPWPLEPEGVRNFAAGLDEVIVVEEKRGLVEQQVRSQLYGRSNAPLVVGKHGEAGDWLFPSNGELGVATIALGLGQRLLRRIRDADLHARVHRVLERTWASSQRTAVAQRLPYFCPGCPHNSSTRIPEGSRAFAGIGCHYLVLPMERETAGFTHMGGEGANWIGLAPYASTPHVFQNIGDGTYFHSGSLAIRASVAAGVNVTYKVLFNDAVAMTGGQAVDGELTVPRVAAQVLAEGVRKVVVVSDDPARHAASHLPLGVTVRPRSELDRVQRELREVPGVTVLIYQQTCATELRRLRKRDRLKAPDTAVVINELVCEGCGDCSRASNCLAVVPVETEFGRKRAVDPAACNQDRACVDGFCPSFVTVEGGVLRKRKPSALADAVLPLPTTPTRRHRTALVVAGVGGTGVVTIGAILGMAAHLDGRAVRVMDMTGLAQKGGAVVSHVQIASGSATIPAAKVADGAADLLLACDLVVAATPEHLGRLAPTGHVVANVRETVTGEFTRRPDARVPIESLRAAVASAVSPGCCDFVEATTLAERLVGDPVGSNLFLVGLAWQRGLIPLTLDALTRAIELNGVAVELNRHAFHWGRVAAIDRDAVERAATGTDAPPRDVSSTVEERVSRRARFLTEYQDARYAQAYLDAVERTRLAERHAAPGSTALTDAVATVLFQLMAYKDEYEVARLHAESGFLESLASRFERGYRLRFHLAPPLLARRDPATGRPRKSAFGPWVLPFFRILARAKRLRGTAFDPFGYTEERRRERALIAGYRALVVDRILPALTAATHAQAVELASAASGIKGYGHVKVANAARVDALQRELLDRFVQAAAATPAGPTEVPRVESATQLGTPR